MNNKGFSLIELLGCVLLMGVVLSIGLYMTKDTLSLSIEETNEITDNEIIESAKIYIIEKNISWNDGLVCININDLVEYGYFSNKLESEILGKMVKVVRDESTKVITDAFIVDECI